MFRKSIEAIIAQGVIDLEAMQKGLQATVVESQKKIQQCQSEIQSLVTLAGQVPEKVFDRYSNVLVGTIEEHCEGNSNLYAEFRLNSGQASLHGIMGNEKFKKGKYRVIVLLEPIS